MKAKFNKGDYVKYNYATSFYRIIKIIKVGFFGKVVIVKVIVDNKYPEFNGYQWGFFKEEFNENYYEKISEEQARLYAL